MDKKAKKRLDVINKKLGPLRQRLAGARQQADEPDEISNLKRDRQARIRSGRTKEELTARDRDAGS
ncbi:MAG: hypothetical protein R3C05_02505 [Pirellulaceae bacterium]